MHVSSSLTGEIATAQKSASDAAASASAAKTASHAHASFAGLLAGATSTPVTSEPAPTVSTGGSPAADVTTPAASTQDAEAEIALRKGESMTAVAGHAYSEIHGGKRDGMFVNTSHNKRRGEAFSLVTNDGKELHVYGSGKDKLVVRVSQPVDPAKPPPPIKLRDGETMTHVPGHHYALIHGGSRDGMFINTSRNSRRGEAFVTVQKDDVFYHVYGAGKDRRVLRCVPHDPGATVASS